MKADAIIQMHNVGFHSLSAHKLYSDIYQPFLVSHGSRYGPLENVANMLLMARQKKILLKIWLTMVVQKFRISMISPSKWG